MPRTGQPRRENQREHMRRHREPTTADPFQSLLKPINVAFWLLIGLAAVQTLRGDTALTNTLLLAVLLRLFRTDIWMAGIMTVSREAIMMPARRTMSRIAKVGCPDNDDDPFEADFQKKADVFDTAFGDMPHMLRRDQDSGNQKDGE